MPRTLEVGDFLIGIDVGSVHLSVCLVEYNGMTEIPLADKGHERGYEREQRSEQKGEQTSQKKNKKRKLSEVRFEPLFSVRKWGVHDVADKKTLLPEFIRIVKPILLMYVSACKKPRYVVIEAQNPMKNPKMHAISAVIATHFTDFFDDVEGVDTTITFKSPSLKNNLLDKAEKVQQESDRAAFSKDAGKAYLCRKKLTLRCIKRLMNSNHNGVDSTAIPAKWLAKADGQKYDLADSLGLALAYMIDCKTKTQMRKIATQSDSLASMAFSILKPKRKKENVGQK
jgi:hypothetical protein